MIVKRLKLLAKRNTKAAAIGFSVTAIGLTGTLLIGEITGYEAEQSLQRTLPNINMLCNTIILASATILALLLTLLGFSSSIEAKLKEAFYQRVEQLAFFVSSTFVITMVIFLLLNFPASNADGLPSLWFQSVYYITIVCSALVGGMIVGVIVLLYETVADLTEIVGVEGSEHRLLADLDSHEQAQQKNV